MAYEHTEVNAEEFKARSAFEVSAKTGKKARQAIRDKQVEDGSVPEIFANARTTPGILTMRGCSYAGCKGVVLGPTRDILQITHGPIGCGFYSWLTRRNQTRPETLESTNFMPYAMSTDLQEDEIIFGGEKKLKAAIDEAVALFHPKAIGIFSTCPVGLIGDDVHAVARRNGSEVSGHQHFRIFVRRIQGRQPVAGHHVANNKVFTDVVGLDDTPKEGKFRYNILGEYNIGGDAFEP